jgi:hypothetical protein
MLTLRKTLLLLPSLLLAHDLVGAQGVLRDPMMPPPAISLPTVQTERPADSAAVPAIQIRKLGPVRKEASIGGKPFQAGEQVGAWRVVRITADSVVLQTSAGSRSVSTPSGVKKNVISGTAPASSSNK